MIQLQEAQNLMVEFIELREKANETNDPNDIRKFKIHEQICIDKFTYLVTMKTGRYKQFNNYDDLNQEGMEALVKSMKNYNPKKGVFFFGGHINT